MSTPTTNAPKVLRNFGFSGARMAVAALGSLLVSVIIARTLGAREMGSYSFLVWVAGTIAALSSMGLPDAVGKFVAEHKGSGEHALAAKIARTIVLAQILVAIAVSLVGAGVWLLLARHHLMLVLLALATVLPSALQQTLLALMEGEQRFDLQLVTTIFGSTIQIAIVAIFAARHASIQSFLLANLLASASITAFTFLLCRPMLRSDQAAHEEAYSPEIVKRIFNFSLSVYALWLLNLIVCDKSELFFLRIFQSPAELAFYSIAFGLTARLATAGDSISYVLFPMFVTRYAQNGRDGLREIYRRSMRYLQMLIVPACLWGIPLTPRLVVFAYGKEYTRVAPVVQVLLGTLLITVTMTVSSNVIYTMERQFSFLRTMVFIAVLNIVLDLLLVPRYGALGAAFANGLSQAAAACGLIVLLRKALPGSFPVFEALKIYVAAALSAIPIFYAELILRSGVGVLVLSVTAAILLYIVLLGGLRAVARSEFEAFGDSFISLVSRRAG